MKPRQEIAFNHVFTMEALCQRWGVDEERLTFILTSDDGMDILPVYVLLEKRTSPVGVDFFICDGPMLYIYDDMNKPGWLKTKTSFCLVVSKRDIEKYEKKYTYMSFNFIKKISSWRCSHRIPANILEITSVPTESINSTDSLDPAEELRQLSIALAEAQEHLFEKNASIAKLKAQLAATASHTASPTCNCKGLPAVVCQMRRQGESEKEIAKYLWDKGQGCSNPQIGALVHPTAKVGETTSDAMTKYAQRLLGKA